MRTSLLCVAMAALACGRSRVEPASDSPIPDAGAVASTPDAGVTPTPDAGPAYSVARVAFHLHSAISHDACDHHATNGGPLAGLDQDCLDQLESALCADRIDVAFLTDHPSFMDDKSIEDDVLLRGRGETPVRDANGNVVGMRLDCHDGRTVELAPGWENQHTMPLGLRRLMTNRSAYGTPTNAATSFADEQVALAAVHEAGGIYFTAHSEEPELPASLLKSLPTDGMEWYNVHGNIIALIGGQGDLLGGSFDLAHIRQFIDTIKDLEPFLLGGHAEADLVYLVLLQAHFPEVGLQKWHEVLGSRFIAGGLGNDVHQNVSVKPLCKGALAMAVCKAAAALYPNVLTALAAEGQLLLSDGKRIDSYARVIRWLNNRALVTGPGIDAARDAMGRGRSYGVFAVLGEPGPVRFQARSSSGALLEMGDQGSAAGATLIARMPDRPAPELGAQWSAADAQRAQLHALLWRTTPSGPALAAEWRDFSAQVELPAPGPGSYSLEIRLVPHHLDGLLGSARPLAANEFRWVLTNAIVLH
jgi:hypothetical protein